MAAEVIYLRREKVLFDASIYISYLIRGRYVSLIGHLAQSSIFYLSSIVYEELLAGAREGKEVRELHRMKKPFHKTGRLITPSDEDWEETGHVIRKIRQKEGIHAVSLTQDALIAISARRQGIRVVTANKKDFEKIRSFKDFKLTTW